jgi:hypothetical protein
MTELAVFCHMMLQVVLTLYRHTVVPIRKPSGSHVLRDVIAHVLVLRVVATLTVHTAEGERSCIRFL